MCFKIKGVSYKYIVRNNIGLVKDEIAEEL